MARSYRLRKRAEARDRVRERILQATMQLHDEQGVAMTSYPQIAERAGVGAATVYRHFPALGDLVSACGGHVWQEMRPPVPESAATVFSGIEARADRLARLIEETDAFYARGALRLDLAARDRDRVPELHGFLTAVEKGVEALVREALRANVPDSALQVVFVLMSFPVWAEFRKLNLPRPASVGLRMRLIDCAIAAVRATG